MILALSSRWSRPCWRQTASAFTFLRPQRPFSSWSHSLRLNDKHQYTRSRAILFQSSQTLALNYSAAPPITTDKETTKETIRNVDDWRNHPDLNPIIHFPSWAVPVSGKAIQTILNDHSLQPYLATRLDLLQHMHLKLKLVRDYPLTTATTTVLPQQQPPLPEEERRNERKIILLHPDTPSFSKLPAEIQQRLRDTCGVDGDGPTIALAFNHQHFSANYILSKLLPTEALPPPAAFETIGHVAHLNLKEQHVPYKNLIGQVLLETLPTIETVIHKVGQVSGPYRTYDFAVVAGRPDTAVQLTEHGVQLQFDVAEVYWCSRLSEERKRLLTTEFQPNQLIADAFCGVGALLLQAASQLNCTILANDWNPDAVRYFQQNAIRNNVDSNLKHVTSQDAYDFLMDIGLNASSAAPTLPDHVVLNFPLKAAEFLGALRWWPAARGPQTKQKSPPRVHVYTFARADDATGRSAELVAVDVIASNLLPPLGGDAAVTSYHRMDELNKEYGCNVHVHPVRDVAPGKIVMCVSFTATAKLLKSMQGDFS